MEFSSTNSPGMESNSDLTELKGGDNSTESGLRAFEKTTTNVKSDQGRSRRYGNEEIPCISV
jgi:hypothetical protein